MAFNAKLVRKFLFISIILIAFACRIYLLAIVPPGLTNDEADIGYDAYSILLTGKDQWADFFPITAFKGFGDYRLPLYTYLVVPVLFFHELDAWSVRLPSAIFGTISVALIYFLSKKLFEKSELSSSIISYGAMTLFAISPWAIGLSRIGIESNVAITLFLTGLLLFLHAFKKPILFIFSFIIFSLTLYTYTSYSFFTPLSILILLFFFRKKILLFRKYILVSVLLFVVIIVPLFLVRSAAGTRASQVTFVFSQDNVGLSANLNDRRGSCEEAFPELICKVFENKYVVIGNTSVRNYINHFSPNFLYVNGTTTQYSILSQRSLLYTVELIFLCIGIFVILHRKIKNGFLILFLLLLSAIPDSLTGDGHFSRSSNMMPFLFLTEGIGVSVIFQKLNKAVRLKFIAVASFALIIIIPFSMFLISYFSYFPKYYSHFGQYGYQKWAEKLSEKKDTYDRIYVSKFSNDTKQYIYYLFYNLYDPTIFQSKKNVDITYENGWVSIDRLENIYFVNRLPSEKELEEMKHKKVLLVSHPNEFPKDLILSETVKDKNNNGVFAFVPMQALLDFLLENKLQDQAL